jgi:hypothetical protein
MTRVWLALLVVFMAQSVAAQTRLAVIVVTFPASDPAPIQTIDWMRDVMADVDAYYAEQSYQQFSLASDVFGVYTVPLDATATRYEIAEEAKRAAVGAGVDLLAYTRFLYISPTTNSVHAGIADTSGAWIALTAQYPAIPSRWMAAHELGHHLFSLPHSPGLTCTDNTPLGSAGGSCQLQEYGNTLDVMGEGSGHFKLVTKHLLGWLTDTGPLRMQTVTTSGDYELQPLESSQPGVKGLAIAVGTRKAPVFYYLEYRQPLGFDASLLWVDPANVFNGVVFGYGAVIGSELLRMVPPLPDDPSPSIIRTPALPVGQTYVDATANVQITVLSTDSAKAVVRVRWCKRNGVC